MSIFRKNLSSADKKALDDYTAIMRGLDAKDATIARLTADNKALTALLAKATDPEYLATAMDKVGVCDVARAIEAENDRDRFIEGKVLAECQRDAAEAKLAKVGATLRSMGPHVRAIRNAVRINDEWGRVVQGQTLAATALAEIFDSFLTSKQAPQPEDKEAHHAD